ncbi:MAG: 4Fe-4S dicluster domain-containing protein [Clostridiales Family XIII bacterium]|jgi:Na+-translocating ferredoxin:NAD+ oxidoreductase RnfC subunit|nr:4Fe-4S dicluster domain-containing protein [Clostridiales Family XIII bacterium]
MLIEKIKQAGVVGAGGAGFPTHAKLNAKADCFIVNAAECEPLIETDKYICRNHADELIDTITKVGAHLGAQRLVIALKRKYKREISSLKAAISKAQANIELFLMDAFYPSGDEQVLVQMVTGNSVPERGIPLAVGCVVDNVGTLIGISDALKDIPVTHKYLSVVGEVPTPVMLHVPIGTSLLDCMRAAGMAMDDMDIIVGGPMMGKVYTSFGEIAQQTVKKTTGNIIVLPKGHYLAQQSKKTLTNIIRQSQFACLQCRMCTELCPRYQTGHQIRPHMIMRGMFREHLIEDVDVYTQMFGEAANCSSCGLCEMYSCPMKLSPRKVNDYIKTRLREKQIDVPKNQNPIVRTNMLYAKAPTARLEARLGLRQYSGLHADDTCIELTPERIQIAYSQHIGAPANPVVKVGDKVSTGDLIAEAPENSLSARIHSGIAGIVEEVNENGIIIRNESINWNH